jgi:ankyrin repeat protein
MTMMDARKFTVLAYAAYRNLTNCFIVLFDYAFKFNTNSADSQENRLFAMRKWVNLPSDDSFVALHFATKHGNYTMLKYLVEKAGADLYIKNKFGATVMHIAA